MKDEQMVDYTAMDAPTMLSFVRDDAWKWAEAFMQTVATGVVVDREFMIGWFANAIEHSTAIRQPQVDAALAAARRAGFDAAKEQAAEVADAFADENIAMAQDSIMNDPILEKARKGVLANGYTHDEASISDKCQIDGTIHSSMFHAAQNIAAAIRALEPKT